MMDNHTPRKDQPVSTRTPKSEGKEIKRRDVLSGIFGKMEYKLTNLRPFFDAIAAQLSKSDVDSRVRYMRFTETPLTLKDLVDFGVRIDREIGVYLDLYQLDPSKRNFDSFTKDSRYTPICLFSGEKIYATDRSGSNTLGAGIGFPPGGDKRYRIIAHYHPTQNGDAIQITKDLKAAGPKIEMVVNKAGLIFFYKGGLCYNDKKASRNGYEYLPTLCQKFLSGDSDNFLTAFNLSTLITVDTISMLDEAQKKLDAIEIAHLKSLVPSFLGMTIVSPKKYGDESESDDDFAMEIDLFGM